MTTLASAIWRASYAQLTGARDVLFWLMLAEFIWVIGDVFQQYAAKYVASAAAFRCRIPISFGIVVGRFGLRRVARKPRVHLRQVIGGSLLMMLGVGAIGFPRRPPRTRALEASAQRESLRYGIAPDYVEARMQERRWLRSTTDGVW